ncbi:MAG TPA: glycosyltransferase family A protein [Methylomirabilota bacterium]|nr:glycosyltransferase family A protein [Methylomirabilota bacterium]
MSGASTRTPAPGDGGPLSVSVVMPTKNRAPLLAEAVRSLLAQTAMADELIVVDQSDDNAGRTRVSALLAAQPAARRPRLVYVLDRSIPGAAAARNVGFDRASGDVIVCWDDDVLAEATVLERLLTHYRLAAECAGLAPLITNYAVPNVLRRLHRWIFCRGPFHDERQPIYWYWRRQPRPARLPVRMFTGAMMSFRRAVLQDLRHDGRYRGASIGEDIDLCWSLTRAGARLAIATDAHIVHNRAPRPAARPEEAMIASWGFLYQKHLPKTAATRLAFAWYVTGVLVGAAITSLLERSPAPLRSALAGVRAVRSDYAGSTFLAPPALEQEHHAGAS